MHRVRRFELRKHPVELVAVADIDFLVFEPIRFRNRREIFKVANICEHVDHAHCVRRVIDDVPSDCRPDESSAAVDDDAVHNNS